jgi:hypothetical protein
MRIAQSPAISRDSVDERDTLRRQVQFLLGLADRRTRQEPVATERRTLRRRYSDSYVAIPGVGQWSPRLVLEDFPPADGGILAILNLADPTELPPS